MAEPTGRRDAQPTGRRDAQPTGRRDAQPTGRREAHKRATRAALTAAAKRLFAERGYEHTTVADIASAANVTQRTFYRYFDGKEGLIAGEYQAWLAILNDSIRERPAAEPPLAAVCHAMIDVGRRATDEAAPAPLWLFSGRPFAGVRQSHPRPLLRLEASVADAIRARLRAQHATSASASDPEADFQVEVLSRVAVAAFRSAIIRHRELRRDGGTSPENLERLLGQAFAILISQQAEGE